MQITFFVGNGFDISCGIHSSYSSFYDWYCKQEKSNLEHVNRFRETIDNDMKNGKKDWADFEMALGRYTGNFTKHNVQDFIDCYEDASEKLIKYLEHEIEQFEEDFEEDKLLEMRKGLKEFYSELPPKERDIIDEVRRAYRGENQYIKFVSYNYTDLLDRCVLKIMAEPLETWTNPNGHSFKLSVKEPVIHAHGNLMFHPIFGLNDESQISNKSLLEIPDFSTLMIKPKCVEALGEKWHDEISAMIDNSTIICIFGMSMGASDTLWFTKITEWLKENTNRHLILFWQTSSPSNNLSNWRFLANGREARKKITDYSDYSNEQIEVIKNRIHVIENTKSVLRIELTKKAEYDNVDVQKK